MIALLPESPTLEGSPVRRMLSLLLALCCCALGACSPARNTQPETTISQAQSSPPAAADAAEEAETVPAKRLIREADLARKAKANGHYAAGYHCFLRRDWQNAIRHFEEAMRLCPTDPAPAIRLVHCYNAVGMQKEAKELAEKLSRSDPDSFSTLHMLARLALSRGDSAGAVELLEKARSAAGEGVAQAERMWVLHQLALHYERTRQSDRLLQVLEETVECEPGRATLKERLSLAENLEKTGRLRNAAKHYEGALNHLPAGRMAKVRAEILFRLSGMYERLNDEKSAAGARMRVAKEVKTAAAAGRPLADNDVLRFGQRLLNGGDSAAALEIFRLIAARQPMAQYLSGLCLIRLKRLKEAASTIAGYLKRVPHDWNARLVLADILAGTGQAEESVGQRKDALGRMLGLCEQGKLDKQPPALLLMMRNAQLVPDMKRKCAETVEARLEKLPQGKGLLDLRMAISEVYYECGDAERAEKLLREILSAVPDQAGANNFLGYMYAERGKNLEEAETLVRKALEVEPNNNAYLDSLAWVYYQQGVRSNDTEKLRQALELLVKACAGMEDPVLFDHRGDVHHRLGMDADAVSDWKKAIELFEKRGVTPAGFEPDAVRRKIRGVGNQAPPEKE